VEKEAEESFTVEQIELFLYKLGTYRRTSSEDSLTHRLLEDISIPLKAQQNLIELIEYYGGYDDIEIVLNAQPKLLKLFNSEYSPSKFE
jgi:hypothetical protein